MARTTGRASRDAEEMAVNGDDDDDEEGRDNVMELTASPTSSLLPASSSSGHREVRWTRHPAPRHVRP